jgi:hypothetical protein
MSVKAPMFSDPRCERVEKVAGSNGKTYTRESISPLKAGARVLAQAHIAAMESVSSLPPLRKADCVSGSGKSHERIIALLNAE